MSELTNDDIINARNQFDNLRATLKANWLPKVNNLPTIRVDLVEKMLPAIDKALPQRPMATMADIPWNHKEHFLAEAKINNPDKDEDSIDDIVIMFNKDIDDNQIRCFARYKNEWFSTSVRPFLLIPTGKKFNLTEVID